MKKLFVFCAVALALAACGVYYMADSTVGEQWKYDPCVDRCQKELGNPDGVVAFINDSGECVCIGKARKDGLK